MQQVIRQSFVMLVAMVVVAFTAATAYAETTQQTSSTQQDTTIVEAVSGPATALGNASAFSGNAAAAGANNQSTVQRQRTVPGGDEEISQLGDISQGRDSICRAASGEATAVYGEELPEGGFAIADSGDAGSNCQSVQSAEQDQEVTDPEEPGEGV